MFFIFSYIPSFIFLVMLVFFYSFYHAYYCYQFALGDVVLIFGTSYLTDSFGFGVLFAS